ncbi:MAG: multicopper oxidase domain-containing protein [Bacteroidia bacterium]
MTKRLYFPYLFLFFFFALFSFSDLSGQTFTESTLSGTIGVEPTVLKFGPDGRLYISQQNGRIHVYEVIRNTANDYSVVPGTIETIDLVMNIPNHDDDGTLNLTENTRQVTGMLVRGTASNPVIYVSSSDPRIGGPTGDLGLDTNSGTISRLTWNGSAWEKVDLVRGLPRSEENHSTNGLAMRGDTLFVSIGGFTNAGGPSNYFAKTNEYAYSSAIVRINLTAIDALPTQTDAQGQDYKYNMPTVDDPDRTNSSTTPGYTDPNDPFGGNDGLNQAKIDPAGPVQIYATGLRNCYDLVITQAGYMFTTDNGANGGFGGYPVGEGPPVAGVSSATNDYNPAETGSVNNKNGLHYVTGPGYYGGHPNPIRANPTGAGLYTTNVFRTSTSGPNPLPADWPPVPAGMANPIEGDFLMPDVDNAALMSFNLSTNGMAEYTASNFSSAYKGDLICVSYNKKVYRINLNATGKAVTGGANILISNAGDKPLGIDTQDDNGDFAGTIWITNHGDGKIKVYEPSDYCQGTNAASQVVFDPSGTGNIDVSTDASGSFQLTNNSPAGMKIEKVMIDLRTGMLQDMVFDPNGTAGESFAKTFTPDAGAATTGYSAFNFLSAHDNGYDVLEIFFTHFDPGETFTFSVDIDPTSIQGTIAPGPNNAGYVSGLELTGVSVTAYYSGCAEHTTRIFAIPGDVEGAENCVQETPPATPTLTMTGLAGPDVTVFTPSQTAHIVGPAGATVKLLVAEAARYISGAGFDLDPYEANSVVNVTEYSAVIGGGGSVDIPVTLTIKDVYSGYNHIVAVIENGGCYSALSTIWRVKYEIPITPLEYTLHINSGMLSTPDLQTFPYLAFNDTSVFSVDNSVVRVALGQTINLKVINHDTQPHNFQVQGQSLSAAAIPAGDSATYSFSYSTEGIYIFYDNLSGQDNSYMGLAGIIDVQLFSGNRFYWNIREHESMWNFVLNTGGTVNYPDYEPDYFTVNGKSYPDLQADTTAIIKANVGETIRLIISNTGLHKHSIHFHGYHLEILYSTKFPSHVGREKDSFPIDPFESLILELTPDKSGTYPVHDHNLIAVTGAGEYPNGMIGFITIN